MTPVDLLSGRTRGIGATLARSALWWAQWPYAAIVAVRNRRFDRGVDVHRIDAPVISIGNLTTGGTGKTPTVAWLCRYLRDRGLRVAILSRGYGADRSQGRNDEAMELERRLPDVVHLQDPDRVASARIAREELAAQCLVLDDAFQHRRLARDLDWVLIDAKCPFGFGHLLPRGLLREPVVALQRADAVLITRADQVSASELEEIRQRVAGAVRPGTPIVATTHRPQGWVNAAGTTVELRSEASENSGPRGPVGAFCAIGNPEAFRQTLTGLGLTPAAWRTFADHHVLSREDRDELIRWADESGVNDLVCTVKDWVKLDAARLGRHPLWALEIELGFLDDPAVLEAQLAGVIARAAKVDAWDEIES